MMLFGAAEACQLEVRRGGGGRGARISGSFPYNKTATLSDGGRKGRPRKERFASRAFRYSVEVSDLDISLLYGHDFNQALASISSSTLKLADSAEALTFTADIAEGLLEVPHVKTTLALLAAGLITGISPGFRIPPERVVPKAETIEDEDPKEGNAIIRTIHEAQLFELSLVSRPAYSETQVEARNWESASRAINCPQNPRFRWR